MFITFEGGEGTGKSTQVKLLAERLRAEGVDVVITREPGGTPAAESLRNLLVSGDVNSWTAEAEALLNYAARDSHLNEIIRPALVAGKTVICDRFMDSTRAYQGYAGGCSMDLIDRLEAEIVGTTRPNTTFVFYLPAQLGLSRAKGRGQTHEDRFERKGEEFHIKVGMAFRTIAREFPNRCQEIDASQSVEDISLKIWKHLRG